MGSIASRFGRLPTHAVCAGGALALLLLAPGAAEAHLRVEIDKTAQRMTIVVDGVRRHS